VWLWHFGGREEERERERESEEERETDKNTEQKTRRAKDMKNKKPHQDPKGSVRG